MNTNTIRIGNTAEKISSGSWKCSLYVTGSTTNIDDIKMEITKNVELKNYKLEKSEGVGFHSEFFPIIDSITVQVNLHLKNGTMSKFNYLLVCNEDGGEATFALEGAKDGVFNMSPSPAVLFCVCWDGGSSKHGALGKLAQIFLFLNSRENLELLIYLQSMNFRF